MKKTLLSVLAFLFAITVVNAQTGNKISYSIGPEYGIPFNTLAVNSGAARDYYANGFGASAKIEVPMTTTLHFTGSAGFVNYPTNAHYLYALPVSSQGPSEGVQPPPFKFIPIKAGLLYYYDQYLYISGEAGTAFGANEVSTTAFIYSAGLGAVVPINTHSGIDISARYERGYLSSNYDSPMSQLALRLAYKFGLKKAKG